MDTEKAEALRRQVSQLELNEHS